jgi:hypothetical protein
MLARPYFVRKVYSARLHTIYSGAMEMLLRRKPAVTLESAALSSLHRYNFSTTVTSLQKYLIAATVFFPV